MSKFVDSTGMSSILEAIKNKFASKSDVPNVPNFWIGDAKTLENTTKKSNTIYFVTTTIL